jgi:hypothetical protein
MDVHVAFHWKCEPQAEQLIEKLLVQAVEANSFAASLKQDLLEKTSTRLFDWLDHIAIPRSSERQNELEESGFVLQQTTKLGHVYHHPGAQLPRVVLQDENTLDLFVSVEQIAQFLLVRGLKRNIEGSPFSPYRRCLIHHEQDTGVWVVERRGDLTIEPMDEEPLYLSRYLEAAEKWQRRSRSLEHEDRDMEETIQLAKELTQSVGINRAAWIVLEVERQYWQARNLAGQIQKNRQDRLGMGWANHDHHTFRSSRHLFQKLVSLFEILGFHCRERFYAGQEAGWGAQVMENSACRLVLFLDVDLAPHEIEEDFAHHPLSDLPKLGTIGLWCALHGDSILKAGMHHLEAQFMFENLTEDLAHMSIKMMNPFSNFPYLKQAFTVGEMWPVEQSRVQKLLKEGKISQEHADKFISQGAVGSHLENLQRREGYKGFNQKNVSFIIRKTDPRQL